MRLEFVCCEVGGRILCVARLQFVCCEAGVSGVKKMDRYVWGSPGSSICGNLSGVFVWGGCSGEGA